MGAGEADDAVEFGSAAEFDDAVELDRTACRLQSPESRFPNEVIQDVSIF
jgi:hypothetical protein